MSDRRLAQTIRFVLNLTKQYYPLSLYEALVKPSCCVLIQTSFDFMISIVYMWTLVMAAWNNDRGLNLLCGCGHHHDKQLCVCLCFCCSRAIHVWEFQFHNMSIKDKLLYAFAVHFVGFCFLLDAGNVCVLH